MESISTCRVARPKPSDYLRRHYRWFGTRVIDLLFEGIELPGHQNRYFYEHTGWQASQGEAAIAGSVSPPNCIGGPRTGGGVGARPGQRIKLSLYSRQIDGPSNWKAWLRAPILRPPSEPAAPQPRLQTVLRERRQLPHRVRSGALADHLVR